MGEDGLVEESAAVKVLALVSCVFCFIAESVLEVAFAEDAETVWLCFFAAVKLLCRPFYTILMYLPDTYPTIFLSVLILYQPLSARFIR